MGYSEKHCRLCAVSFNISRRRLKTEPACMGWMCTGDGKIVGCRLDWDGATAARCSDQKPEDQSDEESSGDEEGGEEGGGGGEGSEDEGGDYAFEEADERDVVLEWDSDDGDGDGDDIVMGDGDEHGGSDFEQDDDAEEAYRRFIDGINSPPYARHDCHRGAGYKGKNITAREMRGCTTAQCILSKAHHPGASKEEPDDQEFERGSARYCLSGLCDPVCSRDNGAEVMMPPRHGAHKPIVDCVTDYNDESLSTAILFHPTCFDIFTRLSRRRFGYVHLDALGDWCFQRAGYRKRDVTSSDRNVYLNSDQEWCHSKGSEYLAANPLFIPRLTPILRSAIQHDDPTFSPQTARPFDVPPHQRQASDVFASLPLEIRLMVLSHLSSRDIANLRLASRTFRQLPVLVWRDLLVREMPWLWEVWSADEPYVWATTRHDAIVAQEGAEKEEAGLQLCLEFSRGVVKHEMPEIFDEWFWDLEAGLAARERKKDRRGFLEKGCHEALEELVLGLPSAETDWYKLYTEIVRNWAGLKGLRNRERIWRDVEKIVEELVDE